MSLKIRVWNTEEDRPATADEIEHLLINYKTDGSGYADIDFIKGNGLAIDPEAVGLKVEVV